MRANSISVISVLAVVWASVGCGAEPPDTEQSGTGVLTFAMTNAPPEARCAVLKVVTDATTTRNFTLVPTEPAVFTVTDLPTGEATLSEQVYTDPCSAIAGKVPRWVSDDVEVALESGVAVDVTFSLHLAVSGSSVTIHSDFPDATLPVTEYGVVSAAYDLESGPDDSIWYTFYGSPSGLGRLTTAGFATEFSPSFPFSPSAFTAGPDGNLYGIAHGSSVSEIVRVSTTGVFTRIAFLASYITGDITTGADGNLWFTEYSENKIVRMSPGGSFTEYAIGTVGAGPYQITAGADGNVWFGEYNGNKIGRITPSGTITEFGIPTAAAYPVQMAAGSDGNVWFIEGGAVSKIGRITPGGTIKEFALPSYTYGITAGADGNLWLIGNGGGLLRVTTSGVTKEFPNPSGAYSYGITAGSDGNVWFSEPGIKKIASIDLSALSP